MALVPPCALMCKEVGKRVLGTGCSDKPGVVEQRRGQTGQLEGLQGPGRQGVSVLGKARSCFCLPWEALGEFELLRGEVGLYV